MGGKGGGGGGGLLCMAECVAEYRTEPEINAQQGNAIARDVFKTHLRRYVCIMFGACPFTVANSTNPPLPWHAYIPGSIA